MCDAIFGNLTFILLLAAFVRGARGEVRARLFCIFRVQLCHSVVSAGDLLLPIR